jgi:molybdopterin-binding protein
MHPEDLSQSMNRSSSVWNHLAGRVISILHGLTRTRVKLMTEDEVILTVRCPSEKFKQTSLRIGQHVIAQVNAHDVLLGTVGKWPGKERWNRWSGRIVLVNPRDSAPLITVKLQGKGCTLTSTGPVVGQPLRPEAWEAVSIVIDPENVTLTPHMFATHDTTIRTHERHRVWLKARVEAVRKSASGSVVSLDVGGSHISALVCGDQAIPYEWAPGLPVEMHVDQWEAWLRPAGDSIDAVMCKLMYETNL